MSIAQFIDHTLLKQTASVPDLNKLCKEAVEYGFAAVCVPPVYVQLAATLLLHQPVKVATVIGFPFGYTYPTVKSAEAEQALSDGAEELDMVMNIAAFKNGDYTTLENEVTAVLDKTQKGGALLKVIIESGMLTPDEIIACCGLYRNFPIAFIKTSTGFAEKSASAEAVQLIRQYLPSHIAIKASGGIKTYSFAMELLRAGATRLGCSASVAILNEGNDAVTEGGY